MTVDDDIPARVADTVPNGRSPGPRVGELLDVANHPILIADLLA